MSNDLNKCTFIGRLGNPPETRYDTQGGAITSISIACGWKGKNKEGVEWIPITAFGKLAEIMAQYLIKGSQVYIEGRFKTDKYDKNGETRYSTKIVADRMQMLGGKNETSGEPQTLAPQQMPNTQQAPQQAPQQQAPPQQFDNSFDQDIPF